MSALCRGPYGGDDDRDGPHGRGDRHDRVDRYDRPGGTDCRDPAVFEVARHRKPPLRVCPVHLGPSLLMASGVLWPPAVTLIARTPGLRP
ncbi:hypothetical protein [Streptomyces sp. NPDC086787]|uniref:hypothetical protein n=1 Tax=Streptomyces sp. NPDC086787 TaxID=3365759 RepID=UPI00381B4B58